MDIKDNPKPQKVVFKQLGNAFRYGMMNDVNMLIKDPDNDEATHFYACIAYMYLMGLIRKETVTSVQAALLIGGNSRLNLNDIVETISKAIFSDLMINYVYENLEKLVDLLNSEIIPDWCFPMGLEIVKHSFDGIFIHEGFLYYIVDGVGDFVKLNLQRIDFNDSLDEQKKMVMLGRGYGSILGFDKKTQKVYLAVENQNDYFHYYDLDSNEYVISSNKFFTMKNDIPYIITRDGFLGYVRDGEIHKIKNYYDYEEYMPQKNRFFVVPKNIEDRSFYPYCVNDDGEVSSADIKDCQKFIWRYLSNIGCDYRSNWRSVLRGIQFDECENDRILLPKEFNVNSILNAFKSQVNSSELCTNKKFIIFENVCCLLNGIVNPSQDITQLLYTLFDINNSLCDKGDDFPSDKLYWRLKDVINNNVSKDVFRNALVEHDYELLKSVVVENEHNTKKEKHNRGGFIGYFRLCDCIVEPHVFDKKDGMILGNQILIEASMDRQYGMVSYDCDKDVYYVTSNDSLSNDNKMQIVKDFKLSMCRYFFRTQQQCGIIVREINEEEHDEHNKAMYGECGCFIDAGIEQNCPEEWEALFAAAKDFVEEVFDT